MRATDWRTVGIAATFAAMVGCGGPVTYTIAGSPKSPELDGKVVADTNRDSSMTTLKIDLEHLAPPERLGAGKVFVVWAKDEKGSWNRVGALKYDDGDRKAKLEGATVPHVSFDLQVTIEKDSAAEAPSGNTLYQQHIN